MDGQTDDDEHELRDSGISVSDAANLNNFDHPYYEEFDLRAHQQDVLNISAQETEGAIKAEYPPPIPPKSFAAGSLERHATIDQDSYSVPKAQHVENGGRAESPC